MLLGTKQEATCSGGRVDDTLARLGVEQLDHKPDQMTWGAELAILTRRSDFAEQVLKGVAHDVLGSRTLTSTGEELVDSVNSIRQHLAFIRIELKVSISHAVIQAGQLGAVSASVAEMLFELAEPGKHYVD
ncbi:hypothetical protein D3C77_434850 [compost metagenome]